MERHHSKLTSSHFQQFHNIFFDFLCIRSKYFGYHLAILVVEKCRENVYSAFGENVVFPLHLDASKVDVCLVLLRQNLKNKSRKSLKKITAADLPSCVYTRRDPENLRKGGW